MVEEDSHHIQYKSS